MVNFLTLPHPPFDYNTGGCTCSTKEKKSEPPPPSHHDPYWYVSVGPGWHPLVLMLEKIAETNRFQITQVKEKWGTLRVYAGGAAWFLDLITACEDASAFICEDCGKEGRTVCRNGWWRTVCEGCEGS